MIRDLCFSLVFRDLEELRIPHSGIGAVVLVVVPVVCKEQHGVRQLQTIAPRKGHIINPGPLELGTPQATIRVLIPNKHNVAACKSLDTTTRVGHISSYYRR